MATDTTTTPTKAGVRTSEFWVTITTVIASVLATSGVITQDQASETTKNVTAIVSGVVAAASVVSYIWSRVKVKLGKQ